MDKIPVNRPSSPEKLTTPQEKLQAHLDALVKYSKPPYDTMDEKLVENLELNVLNAIKELKKEYPELNN